MTGVRCVNSAPVQVVQQGEMWPIGRLLTKSAVMLVIVVVMLVVVNVVVVVVLVAAATAAAAAAAAIGVVLLVLVMVCLGCSALPVGPYTAGVDRMCYSTRHLMSRNECARRHSYAVFADFVVTARVW